MSACSVAESLMGGCSFKVEYERMVCGRELDQAGWLLTGHMICD